MELKFRGEVELIKLVIDRENKKAQIATSKTFYKLIPLDWIQLFDKGKEDVQEKVTDKLNDQKFKKAVIISMAQQGYKYVT